MSDRPLTTSGSTSTSRREEVPLSSHRIEWDLPSSRLEYVKNHPVSYLAQLHSNEKMIAPVWSKVSKTAWHDRAELCSGYGTRMEMTRISVDAPPYFLDPHRVAKRYPRSPPPVYNGIDEAAYVLPAGQSILSATLKSREMNPSGKKNYQIYADGKQSLLRNMVDDTPLPSIRWDSSRSSRQTPSGRVGNTTMTKAGFHALQSSSGSGFGGGMDSGRMSNRSSSSSRLDSSRSRLFVPSGR